jgi:SAM-dependent methyltransferase
MTSEPTGANQAMAYAWDGDEGDHWATNAERYDAGMRAHATLLAEAARITPRENVLDIGCGNGVTTRDAARAAWSARALGLDLSSEMLTRARAAAAAEGLANVEFVQADAQVFPFDAAGFDVMISRFGVMFFEDPVAAFTNIATAVKPGGRLAAIVWRPLAESEFFATIRSALALGRDLPTPQAGSPGPFGLSEPEFVRGVLGAAGFDTVAIDARDADYYVGRDVEDAFAYTSTLGFARGLLADLDDAQRADAFAALRAVLSAHQTENGVVMGSAIWIVTATRR